MKNKIFHYIALLAVLLSIAAGLYVFLDMSKYMPYDLTSYQTSGDREGSEDISGENSGSAKNLSYTVAVSAYRDKRLQFSYNPYHACVVSPASTSFKRGTAIMLDNRTNTTMTITIDKQPYTLKAYGFRIITLTTTKALPRTMDVDCGGGQNNGTILLQQ